MGQIPPGTGIPKYYCGKGNIRDSVICLPSKKKAVRTVPQKQENKTMSEERILTAVISSAAAMTSMCREISRNFIADAVPAASVSRADITSVKEKR